MKKIVLVLLGCLMILSTFNITIEETKGTNNQQNIYRLDKDDLDN